MTAGPAGNGAPADEPLMLPAPELVANTERLLAEANRQLARALTLCDMERDARRDAEQALDAARRDSSAQAEADAERIRDLEAELAAARQPSGT